MIKRIIVLLILINIGLLTIPFYFHDPPKQEDKILSKQTVSQIIDKEMIVDKMQKIGQIVGLDGAITKEFIYHDSSFFGDRTYTYKVHAKFKFGYNVQEIVNGITTQGNTVYIKQPELRLISLDIPLDNIEVDEDVGWLRRKLSFEDQQLIYSKLEYKVRENIMSDNELLEEARRNSNDVIVVLLYGINKEIRVRFIK